MRLRDENSEVRRDEAVHQKVVHRDELEIFGLEEEHPRGAVFRNLSPNLFLKPTQDFPMAQQRQDVVQQERQADRVRKDEVELLDAAQMEQLQILPGPQEQPPQELLQVSQQRALEQMDEQVDGHSSLTQARVRKAFQQDASPDFPGSRWEPPVSPLQEAQHCPAPLKALLLVARAWPQPQDERPVSSPQSPLLASPLRPQLPSPPSPRNAFARAPHVRGRASSSASSFP